MSPIGRTFIVINLIAAGVFAGLSGTLLKNQDNWKQKFTAEQAAHKTTAENKDRQIQQLEQERNAFELAKTSSETALNGVRVDLANLQDENKRLTDLTGQQNAALQSVQALMKAQNDRSNEAFAHAEAAYQKAGQAEAAKDEAVRIKDATVAENRELKNTIDELNGTIGNKNGEIAALTRDNDEQKLLVSAAIANGFLPQMAAPDLAGTVTNVSGKLCTIAVSANPGNVDIQDLIQRRPFQIAIYGDNGYKAEAVAQKYVPSANAILCNVILAKDASMIREGDRASTKP